MGNGATVSPIDCPGQDVFQHVTSKWGFALLTVLGSGPKRFHVLRDTLDGISEKVLAQTLRDLTRDGLIGRSASETVPPQVSYFLTEAGQAAAAHLLGLSRWIAESLDLIAVARVTFDEAAAA